MAEPAAPLPFPVRIEDEMERSYLDYAMSVIIGRALPDVRDGLKPVHRRILYAMYREGITSARRHSKSAGVVGEVLKKYHPHGDAAVYDTMVRMAQDWNMREPLIDGQGNFGSVDGDPPAAYRYTEVRLTRLAEEMLSDIDEETVGFVPNFDGSTEEPLVLPARFPNLIVNGGGGIAVGMATNIPPHNLSEVLDALVALLDKPSLTVDDLMKHIPGPDFPTAAFLHGAEPIREAYRNGRAILQLRARATIEESARGDRESIVVTEIPYQVNKAKLIETIAGLVRDKKIEGISDVRDESDREGMRIVVELKREAQAPVILNYLYKHTQLQDSFSVILLALVNNQPKILNLKQLLEHFLDFRSEMVIRRTGFQLRKAEERAHLLEGLKIALDNLDRIIALIRKAENPQVAREGLVRQFRLSEVQAQAILDMRLQRLTQLERQAILRELEETRKVIARLKAILESPEEVKKVLVGEFRELKEKYGSPRRTQIVAKTEEISSEDLIVEEEMVVTLTHEGSIKRSPSSVYRAQHRGGKGKMGMTTREEDFVEHLFVASTRTTLLVFTDQGKAHAIKVHEIPQASRVARGRPIASLLRLDPQEKVAAVAPVKDFAAGGALLFATARGTVKRTEVGEFARVKSSGIRALGLDEGDRLVAVRLLEGPGDVLLTTRHGIAIRFPNKQLRAMGRAARGVRGITLGKDDQVISMDLVTPKATLLTVTERGHGKRTATEDYRVQRRTGKGIIGIKVTDRNGPAVGTLQVGAEDEIMLITNRGKVLRLPIREIRVLGRNTQGVRLMDLEADEKIVSIARVAEPAEDE